MSKRVLFIHRGPDRFDVTINLLGTRETQEPLSFVVATDAEFDMNRSQILLHVDSLRRMSNDGDKVALQITTAEETPRVGLVEYTFSNHRGRIEFENP